MPNKKRIASKRGAFLRGQHHEGKVSVIVLASALFALLFGIGVLQTLPLKRLLAEHQSLLATYAEETLARCEKAEHRPTCYDKEIPKITAALSMEEAFEVTRLVQAQDPNYFYCHVLGHDLSAREAAKDLSRWKDVVARCPSGMCSNGCIHGTFQERFRTDALPDASVEEVARELEDACEARADWRPTGLEQASCYHALGHLTMYITAANIPKAAQVCQRVARKPDGRDFMQVCYDGVYMQIFQPLEPEDFALIESIRPRTQEAAKALCAQFKDEEQQAACHRESWPLFFKEITTPEGLNAFCREAKDPQLQTRCFNGLFYVVTAQFNLDAQRMGYFCSGLPQERKGSCFANAASRMIETDARLVEKSLMMCERAAAYGTEDECYRELVFYATYNFHSGSENFYHLCNNLPQPWQTRCLEQGNH